jgi:hypothetical protein
MKTQELFNTSKINNYHILTVKYVGPTNFRGSRISIKSDRFNKSKMIDYNYEYNDCLGGAEAWLNDNGFEIVGHGEGKDCYHVITNTFKSL